MTLITERLSNEELEGLMHKISDQIITSQFSHIQEGWGSSLVRSEDRNEPLTGTVEEDEGA
jgi:hypothetical protein